MPAIYVLDVPEFGCLVVEARKQSNCRVTLTDNGYYKIVSDGDLVFQRKQLGVKPAVWYGLFTGGLVGRIAQFDRDTVRIVDEAPAAA